MEDIFVVQSETDEKMLPKSKSEKLITYVESFKTILLKNKIFNLILLVFLPLGFISYYMQLGETFVFISNMLAIVGLAKMLDLATDELSNHMNQTMAALLNVTFGNAVELIVSIAALKNGLLVIVQSSLLGSVLSNLMFVLGFCFFLGGLKYPVQHFNFDAANIDCSLLALTILGFGLPTAFSSTSEQRLLHKDLKFSYGTAIALLVVYISFMIFQFKTHSQLFESEGDEDDEPEMNLVSAIGLLVLTTVGVSFSSQYLVDSVEGFSEQWGINQAFIGLILIPIVGNVTEHISAVYAARRDKMDLAIGIAIGSSIQIAIFVTPLLVIIGWIIGVPLTLSFPIFDVAVIFVANLIVANLLNDGKSNWIEGLILLVSYAVIGYAYLLI
ncbi:hypothetical protein HDV04_005590 [Boothiomyces sp. JEL0838]|nr:hypothetical protein HDV04_005590 [Boothiomyces sp. JEL0838]